MLRRAKGWNDEGPARDGAGPSTTEREGFEPSIGVDPLCRFSKPVPSATRPPLQRAGKFAGSLGMGKCSQQSLHQSPLALQARELYVEHWSSDRIGAFLYRAESCQPELNGR